MKKLITAFFLLSFMVTFGQTDTLVKYAFNDSAFAVGALPTSGITANLNNPIKTKGGTSVVKYNTSGATTWCARAIGWAAGNGTKYWQIKLTTTGYIGLTLSSKQRSSATGPRDFKVQYKHYYANNWSNVAGGSVVCADNWSSGVLSNIALPLGCNNLDTLYLRWVMTSDSAVNNAAVQPAGSSRIDDIIVIGDIMTGLNINALQHEVSLLESEDAITLSLIESAKEIMIYDIIGNLVYKTTRPLSTTVINTSKLNNGIYIVKIFFCDNAVVTKKIYLF